MISALYYLLIALWILPLVFCTCVFPADDAKPRGLEERAIDSEVVLAAYTRTVYRSQNSTSTSYSAEFLVFNIIKGEDRVVEVYQNRKPSSLETALNRRLVNVSNFGDPSKCESDVNPGETYILLLDVLVSGGLSARYDGAYGPAVVYSRDKEMALEAIGSSPWGEWSPCSGSCGGGIQQRRRHCEGGGKCSNEEGQQRTCNMFSCTGVLNILEVAGVHRSSLRPSGRPTAYKLLPSGSWRSGKEEIIFPRTFPWEFSLLVTVRVKPSSSGGFLLRVLHSESLQVGLYISDILTLVLSDKNNIRVSFIKSLFDDHWHQLAFSVRRDTVSFYMNCEYSGKLPLPGKIRPFGGQPATVIVGSTGDQELDAFQGDIEQITITGSPDAAEKQCNATTQPLNLRTGNYPLRQEVRSRPMSLTGTQNDQLPLRGDIIDDEDFSFDSGSGDHSPHSDDDYDGYDNKRPTKDSTQRDKKIPLKAVNPDDLDNDDDDEDEDDLLKDKEDKDEDYDEDDDKDEKDDSKNKEKSADDKHESKEDNEVVESESKESTEDSSRNKEHTDDSKDENVEHDEYNRNEKHSEDVKSGSKKESDSESEIKESDSGEKRNDEERQDSNKDDKLNDTDDDEDYETDDTGTRDSNIESENTNLNSQVNFTDYEHIDEEPDKEDDDIEGSGVGTQIELAWSEWSPCSSTCSWGRRTRTSYCLDNALNLESCAEASSKRFETEACFVRLCPTTTTTLPTTTTSTTVIATTPILNVSVVPERKGCRVHCSNGGICQPPYRCICPRGFYGSLCQYVKQPCRVNCKNGGTCLPPSSCSCAKGYFGSECQYALCKPQCLNGGTCVASNKCRCKPGYVGNSCHKAVCQHGCKNGGECVAPNKCACRSGFTGKDCSQPHCDPMCQNGGECMKPYFCHCPPGTKGTFCEKFHCKPECQNGGVCVGKGKCSCPKGYTGFNCEQAFCPGGCFNGGKCGKTGKCTCATGYTGLRCETKKPCKFVEIKEPYKRGYKQKVTTQAKVPCGAWGWKLCTKTKVHYEMVYKTFYKTSYECEDAQPKSYPDYQKLKHG